MSELNASNYLDVAKHMKLIAHHDSAAGVVYWLPAGLRLYEKLKALVRDKHRALGYQEVRTPNLAGVPLFEQSGHLEKYCENMFVLDEYVLRPMSCPNHLVVYQSEVRSYRDLPLALFEFGDVFRNEASGALQLLFRQRQFCQDDSHVFCARDPQSVQDAVVRYLRLAQEVYQSLGLHQMHIAISLRPAKRFGDDAQWDASEQALRDACDHLGLPYLEQPGEGAFYGPKIELGVKDVRGRVWQMGTIQLDDVLPRRFEAQYIDAQGQAQYPIVLHHAVLGSLERSIGVLLDSYGVNLPAVVHPYPDVVMAVSDRKHGAYVQDVVHHLRDLGHEVHEDVQAGTLASKVQYWKALGVKHMHVVGDKEMHQYVSPRACALAFVSPSPS